MMESVYQNNDETIPEIVINKGANIYALLSGSFEGVKRLFVLYDVTDNDKVRKKINRKYFLLKTEIFDALIDGRNFYDQSINDLIKQNDEVSETSTGLSDDYTTGYLLSEIY